jgi:hypothetical protein
MDSFYFRLLSDSLNIPPSYLDDVDREEAGKFMLTLTYFRTMTPSSRLSFETALGKRAKGQARGFYQYLINLKTWASADPYHYPWCLTAGEFNEAVKQISKGKIPGNASEVWYEATAKQIAAATALVGVVITFMPELAASGVGGAVARTATVAGGVAGASLLNKTLTSLTSDPTVVESYKTEAQRRFYVPSI